MACVGSTERNLLFAVEKDTSRDLQMAGDACRPREQAQLAWARGLVSTRGFMSAQALSQEAISLLRNAVGDEGTLSVTLPSGALSEMDPFLSQLLIAGYIRLRPSRSGPELAPDRLVYEVTEAGRAALA